MKQTFAGDQRPVSTALEAESGGRTAAVMISEKAERSARAGHPWIFADEIVGGSVADFEKDSGGSAEKSPCDGELVRVYTRKGRFVGTGFYNSRSKIRVRILSTNANDRFDRDFWARRVRYALDYRRTVMGSDFSACRLIFGEADSFPGLTVDLFDTVLSVQSLCLGMDRLLDTVLELLVTLLQEYGVTVRAVYLRNDVAIRELEGMEQFTGYWQPDRFPPLHGEDDGTVLLTENGIRYRVDYKNGQKTGFFLDQKYNRRAAASLAAGKMVLDCFTHTGAFGLNCAAAGAKRVVSVDISESAIAMAKENARLNNLSVEYVCADVFALLTKMAEEKRREFDYIILDPPAFTKSQTTVHNAYNGYKEINLKAMKLLPRGGYLATCSCSHFMGNELFCKMLADAARDAKVNLRQIEARTQAPDHPILWNVRETDYLKFYLFQVV